MIIQELHSKSRKIETVVRDLDKMVNTSCPNCIMRQKLNELKKLHMIIASWLKRLL